MGHVASASGDSETAHPSPAQPSRFWELLTAGQRAAVERAATRHDHPAGTVLILEGATARSAFVLRSGRVKVVATGRTGRQTLLAIRVPGDIVGELAATDGRPRSASVVAIDPVSLLRLSAHDVTTLLTGQPGIALAVLTVVVDRFRLANTRRIQYAETTVAQRLAILLTELADQHGQLDAQGITITLHFGQDDLADMVVGSREAVVRALRALRDSGIISTGRQRLAILEPELLGNQANI